jgi:hypothetical protein
MMCVHPRIAVSGVRSSCDTADEGDELGRRLAERGAERLHFRGAGDRNRLVEVRAQAAGGARQPLHRSRDAVRRDEGEHGAGKDEQQAAREQPVPQVVCGLQHLVPVHVGVDARAVDGGHGLVRVQCLDAAVVDVQQFAGAAAARRRRLDARARRRRDTSPGGRAVPR